VSDRLDDDDAVIAWAKEFMVEAFVPEQDRERWRAFVAAAQEIVG
jgi:hypothetical protein